MVKAAYNCQRKLTSRQTGNMQVLDYGEGVAA